MIGYPECSIILSQVVAYLASSPKSNSAVTGIGKAQALVKQTGDLSVPLHIRNAPTRLMKNIGYGKGYGYAHDYDDNFVDQEFLPDTIAGTTLYEPGSNASEDKLRAYLRSCWKEKYGY